MKIENVKKNYTKQKSVPGGISFDAWFNVFLRNYYLTARFDYASLQ